MSEGIQTVFNLLVGSVALWYLWVWPIRRGLAIAREKNRSPHWLWFGLHPFGAWIAYAILRSAKALRQCPDCAETIQADASICRHCGRTITPADVAGAPPPLPSHVPQIDIDGRPKFLRWFIIAVAALELIGLLSSPLSYKSLTDRTFQSEAIQALHDDKLYHDWAMATFWLSAILALFWLAGLWGMWKFEGWGHDLVKKLLLLTAFSSLVSLVVATKVFWIGPYPESVLRASEAARGERFLLMSGTYLGAIAFIGLAWWLYNRMAQPDITRLFEERPATGGAAA